MKRLIYLTFFVSLFIQVAQAQDQDKIYKLNADACKPGYMLPDHDPAVKIYDKTEYSNEQYVVFCVTVTDQLGTIQTDPHLDNFVISAADAKGDPIPLIHDAYKEQLPGDFTYEIVLVLDASGSMAQSIQQMQRAALDAIRASRLPDPYYAVMAFNTKTEFKESLTQNDQRIEDAINAVQSKAGSYTCLYDAVDEAIKLTAINERSRRIVILFTDGKNDDKEGICKITKAETVIKDAQLNGTSIFAIGLEGNSGVDKKQLDSLTQQTNGKAEYGGSETLPTLFEAILSRLYSMRVMTALVCSQGVITLTMQANIDGKPALPTSTILNLDNTQCVPPVPVAEATATIASTQLPQPIAETSFDVIQNAQAQDIATFSVNFSGRSDIVQLKANIRDADKKDASPEAQKCDPLDAAPGKFDCHIDVSGLKPGTLTLSLYPYGADETPLTEQPIDKDYLKEDVQPQLNISPDGGNLLVKVNYPVAATGAVLTVRSVSGVALPVPGTFSGDSPYRLSMENVDVDTVTVQAALTYGSNTRNITSEPITLQRSFVQQISLFLRMNGLLVGALVALGAVGTAWLLWRRRGGISVKEDEWLRSPVPEATRLYAKSTDAPAVIGDKDAATKIYDKKLPVGELEIVHLATDPSRQGSRISVTSPFTIGRSATCDLVINDEFLSRTHLTILQQDGIAYIKDIGSSNGTVVNGQALTANQDLMLKDRSEIILGTGITLRYLAKKELLTRMMPGSK